MKIILEYIRNNDICILLVVNSKKQKRIRPLVLSLKYDKTINQLKITNSYDMCKPCFVIRTISSSFTECSPFSRAYLLNLLLSRDLNDVILASVANHPQYPTDPYMSFLFEDDILGQTESVNKYISTLIKDLNKYCNYAVENGISLDQPKLLYITHMLASTYSEELNHLSLDEGYVHHEMLPVEPVITVHSDITVINSIVSKPYENCRNG